MVDDLCLAFFCMGGEKGRKKHTKQFCKLNFSLCQNRSVKPYQLEDILFANSHDRRTHLLEQEGCLLIAGTKVL